MKFLDNYLDKCIGIILIIAVAILINKIVDKLIDMITKYKEKKLSSTLERPLQDEQLQDFEENAC